MQKQRVAGVQNVLNSQNSKVKIQKITYSKGCPQNRVLFYILHFTFLLFTFDF